MSEPIDSGNKPGYLTDATVHAIREELGRAREKHPEGATLAGLMKCCGDLAAVMLSEGRDGGAQKMCASVKARYEAVQAVVVLIRLIEGR